MVDKFHKPFNDRNQEPCDAQEARPNDTAIRARLLLCKANYVSEQLNRADDQTAKADAAKAVRQGAS